MTSRADRFTALLDANVLVGALARNMLLSLAEAGLFRPRWSAEILDECERALARRIGNPSMAKTQRGRMQVAFPEAMVTGYRALAPAISLPDPDDAHVVAAAIRTRATVIVTDNLRDFPVALLSEYDLQAVSLDGFLADLLDLAGPDAVTALTVMRRRFRNPTFTGDALIRRAEELGLLQTADLLGQYRELL